MSIYDSDFPTANNASMPNFTIHYSFRFELSSELQTTLLIDK